MKLLLLLLLVGCASAPLTEEAMYLAEEKKILRKEEILTFIKDCDARGHVLVTSGHMTSLRTRFKKKRPQEMTLADIPRHAHITDYQCGSPRDIGRAMDQIYRGY